MGLVRFGMGRVGMKNISMTVEFHFDHTNRTDNTASRLLNYEKFKARAYLSQINSSPNPTMPDKFKFPTHKPRLL